MPASKSQKGRKIGRNKKWCEAYKLRQRREENKARRLIRHLKRQGRRTDAIAVHCLNQLPERFKPAEMRSLSVEPTLCKRIPPKFPMVVKS